MNIILIFLIIIFFLLLLAYMYIGKQFPRIDAVYDIRMRWIRNNDNRYYKYSWNDMLRTYNIKTWYGLKIPKEEDFE